MKGDLNSILNNISKDETKEAFQELRAIKNDSPMRKIKVFGKLTGGQGVMANAFWDSGSMFPTVTLHNVRVQQRDSC